MSQEMEERIDEGIAWLKALKRDLLTGKAKEVPMQGHSWSHLLPSEPISLEEKPFLADVRREICHDLAYPYAIVFYIATCPRTGIRFVEGTGKVDAAASSLEGKYTG